MLYGRTFRGRPIEEDDQPFLQSLSADPAVRRGVVGWSWPLSLHEQRRWFETAGSTADRRWVIESDGELVGMTGLWQVDWHNRNAVTGLKLSAGGRGRGLAVDVVMAVMAFAFYDVGLHRLHAPILATNAASLRVYRDRCGWALEGTARSHVFRDGDFVDVHQLGILREDFERLPDAATYRRLAVEAGAENAPSPTTAARKRS
ncbi:GNAT family N-acetyltransferase [Thalassiella azotivora]